MELKVQDYHQWYLADAKNPDDHCSLGGTSVNLSDPGEDAWGSCPTGLITTDDTATAAN